MVPPPTRIKSREVCMTDRDWQAFGDALKQLFPAARYFSDIPSILQTPSPPKVDSYRSLSAISVEYPERAIMVFDQFSSPSVVKSVYSENHPEKWLWTLKPPPHPYVWLGVGNRIWEHQGPAHLSVSEVHFYMTPRSKEHEVLARKFYRLLDKFITNRGLAFVRYPDYLVTPAEKGLDLWCGHDAIRWAREDSKRFLCFNGRSGLRPADAIADVLPFKRHQS